MRVFTKQEVLDAVDNRLSELRVLADTESPFAKMLLEQAGKNAVVITALFVAGASATALSAALHSCGWGEVAS